MPIIIDIQEKFVYSFKTSQVYYVKRKWMWF